MNALELHGLEKHYPDFTLGPIDLELPGKEKCAYFIILDDQSSSLEFLSSLLFS